MKKPLIVLTGPTAVGKTRLSISLAKAWQARHICRLHAVYKYMVLAPRRSCQKKCRSSPLPGG